MSSDPTKGDPSKSGGPGTPEQPSTGAPRRGFGMVEWVILLGIAGLIIYGQFFGGSC